MCRVRGTKADPIVQNVRDKAEPFVQSVKDKAGPFVQSARDKAAPYVKDIWDAAQKATATAEDSPVGREYDEWLRTHFMTSLLWLTVCVSWFLCFLCCDPRSRANVIDDQVAQIASLADSHTQVSSGIGSKLKGLYSESVVGKLQAVLNDRVDKFRDFLQKLNANPGCLGGDEADATLAGPLAILVQDWLQVFKETSMDPIVMPHVVTSNEALFACKSVQEVCTLTLKSLDGVSLKFLDKLEGQLFQKDKDVTPTEKLLTPDKRSLPSRWALRCTWLQVCCLNRGYDSAANQQLGGSSMCFPFGINLCVFKVRLLSCRHFVLLICFACGFALCVYMLLQHTVCAALCLLGQGILLTLLLRFESLDVDPNHAVVMQLLSARIEKMKYEAGRLKKSHSAVSGFADRSERLIDLWRCRTQPQLGVLEAIINVLISTRWKSAQAAKDFIAFADTQFENQAAQLGPLSFWVGQSSPSDSDPEVTGKEDPPAQLLNESAFRLFKDQLERCEAFVKLNKAKVISQSSGQFCLLNFAAVRVLGCTGLPEGSCFEPLEPYVRVRIGRDPESWLQTDSIPDSQDPKWHNDGLPAEFHMNAANVQPAESPLEVQVLDVNNYGDDIFLGKAAIDHKALGAEGKWTGVLSALDGTDSGEVQLEIYVATNATHLTGIKPYEPSPPSKGGGKANYSRVSYSTKAAKLANDPDDAAPEVTSKPPVFTG